MDNISAAPILTCDYRTSAATREPLLRILGRRRTRAASYLDGDCPSVLRSMLMNALELS